MQTILGLDLGTNSIGWALIEKDENDTGRIIDAGSRIIPMSQDMLGKFDSGQSISQTAERTGYRGIRRLRERELLRRERLHRVLNILGFLPSHYANQIDFENRRGKLLPEMEPKLAYVFNIVKNKADFLFKASFDEMLQEFTDKHPELTANGKKIPYDWTIYYLRKKALTEKIEKEELAWLLLQFNQKRGYYQLRGEEEEQSADKQVEFHALLVTEVVASEDKKSKDEVWYNVHLENGWIYRRSSKVPLDWKGKIKEFVVTTDLDEDGNPKTDKEGKEKRSFRAPDENDWSLVKTKTEKFIENSHKTVGQYIYDNLLENPSQKIKGKLVRVIERDLYKTELATILKKQKQFHLELNDKVLYKACIEELYGNNDVHRGGLERKDFVHLFLNDIIFYQRPLKSKKSLISNCKHEARYFVKDGVLTSEPVKCIAKSNPLYQEFRIWQFVSNLKIYQRGAANDIEVTDQFLSSEDECIRVFEWLNQQKEVSQAALLKYLAKLSTVKYRWNYVEDKKYPGNETRALMLGKLKEIDEALVDMLTTENETALWHILYSIEDKVEVEKALAKFIGKVGLTGDLANAFVEKFKRFPRFEREYGSFSAKALKKLLPLMRIGKFWNADNVDPKTLKRIENLLSAEVDETISTRVREQIQKHNLNELSHFRGLPTSLAEYVVYDRHSESNSTKLNTAADIDVEKLLPQHSLRNPIVEQIIKETLQTVKDIWNYYGKGAEGFFDEIHVELGREMKNPKAERERMTKQISQNENTNLRIKALLLELRDCGEVENVRPYSPMQQEILKIYEEGALLADNNLPDDIAKIAKKDLPTPSELTRYRLWLEQKYRSPYTGEVIPLSKLFTRAYDIEHIIPQSRYFDDSYSNKVICEAVVNGEKYKANRTGYQFIKEFRGRIVDELSSANKTVQIFSVEAYEEFVKRTYGENRGKMKKLLMEEIPEEFVQRQMNDSRYISREVVRLLSNIVKEEGEIEATSKHVISTNGNITNELKQHWGLNDIWNELISPRFVRLNGLSPEYNNQFGSINPNTRKFLPQVPLEMQKGFNKKRIDHRHHALDAIVIACATREHVNLLNNQHATEKGKSNNEKHEQRFKLRSKLCKKQPNADDPTNYKWVFKKPWDTFTQDSRTTLETIVVSFKQNLRVINKTKNKHFKWERDSNGQLKKVLVAQEKGENWAVRKPMHKDTVSGLVKLRFKKVVALSAALDTWENIVDKDLRDKVKELVGHNYDKKMLLKYFKDRSNQFEDRDVSKVELYFWNEENVASRVKLDESFNAAKIEKITAASVRKILLNHLALHEGKPELAFSPDGIDAMNKNLVTLNGGKPHQPIYKVRTYEPKGNKFKVGEKGNKKAKYVEAAKGTNLFFAIYVDETGKRNYESIPLNIVIERQKQGLISVPEVNEAGHKLVFYISPNDLVYVPYDKEADVAFIPSFENLSPQQTGQVYKVVSFSGTQCFFVLQSVAIAIVDRVEFGLKNKTEKTIDGRYMIKASCIKLKQNRLGKLSMAH
jgi:CRISPR-associated endonuclease Csn1